MNQDRNGTQQAANKARCGRLALSMLTDEGTDPVVVSPSLPEEMAPAAPKRTLRLSTSERLRRLEEFSAA